MKVSIIMLTYNHEKFIEQALKGVLVQETNFPFELIVANDCSTDNTEEIIKAYRNKFPVIIKGYDNKRNLGPRYNFIKAYGKTTGEYIAMCEGDDYWTDPLKLQKQVDFLAENKNHVLCFHNTRLIDEAGSELKNDEWEWEKRDYDINEMLGVYIPTPTIVYRKILKNLPSSLQKTDNGDTLVLAALTSFGKAKYLPEVKESFVRKHPGGIWTSKSHLDRWSDILKLRYLIFRDMDTKLRPGIYKNFTQMFDKASLEALDASSKVHWYNYSILYAKLSYAAGRYGRAWLISKRIIKRYFGFEHWLPDYHKASTTIDKQRNYSKNAN